jgi:ATP adenylyltransferase
MEVKWTPWRMAYIQREDGEECVFCHMPAADNDIENLIVWRGQYCYVVLNLFPYNTGHLMVVPYAHVGDLTELDGEAAYEMTSLAQKGIRALRLAFAPQGFNLGMNLGRIAGAGIADHLHLHIVPRWQGDTNFMPLIAGTKLIPELLEDTCQKIRQAFEEEGLAASLEGPQDGGG